MEWWCGSWCAYCSGVAVWTGLHDQHWRSWGKAYTVITTWQSKEYHRECKEQYTHTVTPYLFSKPVWAVVQKKKNNSRCLIYNSHCQAWWTFAQNSHIPRVNIWLNYNFSSTWWILNCIWSGCFFFLPCPLCSAKTCHLTAITVAW